MMADTREFEIARLGAEGDGIADLPGEPLFVPFALPGERWRREEGHFVQLTQSPDRRPAICRHFGRCGGCATQHFSAGLDARWKRDIVAGAFRHRGIEAEIAPLQKVALHSRRRAFLGVERQGSRVVIGFREEGRHALVDLEECPVLDPMIVAALGPLRAMACLAMPEGRGGRLVVTRLDRGLDVAFDNGTKALPADTRQNLAALADAARLVRLTVAGELIAMGLGPPKVTVGGVAVEATPGVFLQAVPEAEARLVTAVEKAVPQKAKRVADLFCGIGTFTFPLARRAAVTAVDGDRKAIAALAAATKQAKGLEPIEAAVRDLFREPLSPRELDTFDAVVFDPPRAGAAAQAERIARSKVPLVIAVSCNPATLARDARTLIDGGYRMGPVTPIDQFLFSPHVEAVTAFAR